MVRTGSIRRVLVASSVAIAALLVAPPAHALSNGGFEAGTFSGWTVTNEVTGTGNWFVYTGTTTPLSGRTIPPPPQGTFAAVTDQTGQGSHVLYRKLKLPADAPKRLSFTIYYDSADPICVGTTLSHAGGCNQQFRVDILRKSADPFSVASSDVLKSLFATQVGDPQVMAPTRRTFSLKRFAGRTVLLRFAEVDNQNFFNAGVDAVSLKQIRTSEPPSNCTTADICNG